VSAYLSVEGQRLLEVRLHVPNAGPWWADVVFEGAPALSGAVELAVGALRLRGTLSPLAGGVFGAQRHARIVAGGGGWGTLLEPLHYHNDGGVRVRTVAEDAARLAGERLGELAPERDPVGVDYVRQAGPASRVLEDVIGAAAWWVDYDGLTHVGERAAVEVDATTYQVLEHDPRQRLATLAVDEIGAVPVGAVLTAGLEAPLTVRELDVRVTPEQSRVMAWGGGGAAEPGRLAGLVRGIVERVVEGRLYGRYRYRVAAMSGDRVELQAVSRTAGLPDTLPVSQRPGAAGAHARLSSGALVLVEFIEGDRTLPVVTAFAGRGEQGHAADELDLSVTTALRLGGAGASEGVLLGTSHKDWADKHTHGYLGDSGTPANTTPPIQAGYLGGPGVPDPAPAPSSKVFVE